MTLPHLRVRIGPAIFDLRSPFAKAIADSRQLYRDYPQGLDDQIYDFAIKAVPISWSRRWIRPAMTFEADYQLEEIVPVEARLGMLGMEMAVNMQMALGYRREIVLHAASAARDTPAGERAVLIVGDSGAGKSTLSALLSYTAGWRHFGDELALITMGADTLLRPYPRPIGLKNESIAEMESCVAEDRFGPRLENTVKGTMRHLLPPLPAIAAMDRPAPPALIVSPHFTPGAKAEARQMPQSEAYLRLSVASTNQLRLGEAGFDTLVRLIRDVPAYDITYGNSEDALALVNELWNAAT
ncbi:MAG: HprK-related kinase A [Pacificimonas sp.]